MKTTMMDWTDFKQVISDPGVAARVMKVVLGKQVRLVVEAAGGTFECRMNTGTTDHQDFVANYEGALSASFDSSGRPRVRQESWPDGWTLGWTTQGDDTGIGDGVEFLSDASITPTPDNPHIIEMSFIDNVVLKDGYCGWINGSKECRLSVDAVCMPNLPGTNSYYPKNDGTYGLATTESGPIAVLRYIHRMICLGDCPMGVHFEAETASDPLPAGWKLRLTVERPTNNVLFLAFGRVELYRARTRIV